MTTSDDDGFAGRVARLQAPILVLGASGFVGANLLLRLLEHRSDVVGTCGRSPAWRLEEVEPQHIRTVDLLVDLNLDELLDEVQPRTVFNCVAYGAYSFETDRRADLPHELRGHPARGRAACGLGRRRLRPRRQLLGVRRQRRGARRARLPLAQQRLRRLESGLREPAPLLRPAVAGCRARTSVSTPSTARSRTLRG